MKTTTYLFADGKMTVTVEDKPELTREEYKRVCGIIKDAAKKHVASKRRRSAMDIAADACGLKKVRGNLGGIYYE